jgi:predicted transcriptional regulator
MMDYWKEVVAAGSSNNITSTPQADEIRNILLNYINENPGIWYRELLRLCNISNGSLTHHLRVLEESDRIKVDRKSSPGRTRYYSLNVSDSESKVIGLIKNTTAKQIILLLLQQEFCTFSEIVDSIGKSPSTISWHMKRLVDAEVVNVRHGGSALYNLVNRDSVADVISKYKETLLDRAANNYSDIIDEL